MRRNRYSIDRLFEGNKLVLMCVLFTVNVLILMISAALVGESINLTSRAIIWQFVFLSCAVLPLTVFQHLWESGRIDESNYLLWTGVSLHYVISCALTLLVVFVQSFFVALNQGVYIVVIVNFSIGYFIIIAGAIAVDLIQTSRLNQKLRRIQASQNGGE